MRFVGSAMVVVLAAVGTSARAQDLPTVERSIIDLSPFLQPGSAIRISGTALRRVGGYVVGVRADTMLIGAQRHAASSGARSIGQAAVDTLWTRGTWIWPGLPLGTSLGLLVGGAVCVFSSSEKCNALPIAIAGGTALGLIVGKVRTVWHKRYVRRDGGPVPVLGS